MIEAKTARIELRAAALAACALDLAWDAYTSRECHCYGRRNLRDAEEEALARVLHEEIVAKELPF